jgi:type II secretory pathway predicted ATPase ExeA/LysM repeat protein
MFLDFYRLREQPFGVTPDPRFLYMSETHREALASLFYGIKSGRGFMALVAKPGMGKTSILFRLMQNLEGTARTVFLFQTQCDSREFLKYLLADMGIHTDSMDLVKMHSLLNDALAENTKTGKQFVVIVDEAQNLDPSVLETVRLLSDFETTRNKLMQIILAGQPQLAEKLAAPSLVQLSQRISILSRLKPFSVAETSAYIGHRLSVAGHSGDPLFTTGAVELIGQYSQGIPRNINNLCFNALSWGYAVKKEQVDADIIREVAAELEVIRCADEPVAQAAQEAAPPPVSVRVPERVQPQPAPRAEPAAWTVPAPAVMAPAASAPAKRSWRNIGIAAGVAVLAFVAGYGWQNAHRPEVPPEAVPVHAASPTATAVTSSTAQAMDAQPARANPAGAVRRMQVPSSSVPQTQAASAAVPGISNTAAGNVRTIVVQPNDTLWGLSQKYLGNSPGGDFGQISRMNNLTNPNHIEVGQRLVLPVPTKDIVGAPHGSGQANPSVGDQPRR